MKMKYTLNPVEARVLGVLIEKQLSTPEYYPLTVNLFSNLKKSGGNISERLVFKSATGKV
jgi:uncharacterized protein YceH (UPF0502 family)